MLMVGSVNFKANYSAISFGEKEVYTGPDDLKTCVCRFCGKRYPEVKFKKRNAHAIPDALGNKLVFCNDECKNCNSSLSTIDKELTEYLKFRRADFKIANKNNKIIQVWGHNFFYNGPTGELKISRLAILKEIDNSFYVKLEGADPITHLGIYKALAKIAIDLMPRNMVDDFHTTIDWIKGDFIPKSLPNIFFAYCKAYVSQPKVTVFMLKDCVLDAKLPKCIVALALTDLIFFYIVPFGKGDVIYKGDFLKRYVPSIIERIQAVEKVVGIDYIDMEDRVGKFSHVKEWIDKSECDIVDQSYFNHTQEKNPNKVDFPVFDSSLVDVINVVPIIDYLVPDAKCTDELRMEETFVKLTNMKMHRDVAVPSKIYCLFAMEILRLDSKERLLSAECRVDVFHRCISQVYSIHAQELSPFFVEFLLDVACKNIGSMIIKKFYKYDFSKLAEFLMESTGQILHPKEGIEQSVINKQ